MLVLLLLLVLVLLPVQLMLLLLQLVLELLVLEPAVVSVVVKLVVERNQTMAGSTGHPCAWNGAPRPPWGWGAGARSKGWLRLRLRRRHEMVPGAPNLVRVVLAVGVHRPCVRGLVAENISVLVENGHGRALVERHARGHGAELLLEKGLHFRRDARSWREPVEPAHGWGRRKT